ncbi:MAG: ADP-ribosylglycohydrolase family protein [Bacteroidales bacterium]|nr:ADP-ribosylglycohydrolase family protein [Bacteroidales bacterium]
MYGAIIGDIAGSTYEFRNAARADFELFPAGSTFTDDTVLTIAVADAIMSGRNYKEALLEFARKYPNAGYGMGFMKWFTREDPRPYNSFGNGSAMRVSAVAWAFNTIEEVVEEAKKSAEPTHNHPEGIKGAQATSAAVFLALQGKSKKEIKEFMESEFSYRLPGSYEELRATSRPNVICQETVPQALTCFLESDDFEDALRKAIWLGGDSDTIACISGSMAEAFYRDIPASMISFAEEKLDDFLLEKVRRFRAEV